MISFHVEFSKILVNDMWLAIKTGQFSFVYTLLFYTFLSITSGL